MAGIYIHIPFCKQACHYCDFHFSTNLRNVEDVVGAMKMELNLQSNYMDNEVIQTIYFGGGTPSAIPVHLIGELIDTVKQLHQVDVNAEISLEANPDDLTKENLEAWKSFGVNRLSVGVQSFVDEHLVWMNRAHTSTEAINGLTWAKEVGFSNITMDLIYGIPGMSMKQWESNLQTFFDLDLPHLSAYGLTIEDQTHLGHLVKTKQVYIEKDENYNLQFEYLMNQTQNHGFAHYEISNFGKPGFQSRHNTAYWLGEKYAGIGPSAHAFNGKERRWNVASNMKYIKLLHTKELPSEVEQLSENDQFNEYVLIRLRTIWGIDERQIKTQFGEKFQNILKSTIRPYMDSGHVIFRDDLYTLSRKGKYLADKISSDLFVID